jgi:putative ABC transport system permease protein
VLKYDIDQPRYVTLRLLSRNIPESLAYLDGIWRKFAPQYPFQHYFMDERFERFTRREELLAKGLSFSAGLAVLLSCLGILGLISFLAEQKTKEIGIRRVLGASAGRLMGRLTREVLKWVLTANIIAWPAAYFLMNRWLFHFPYRTSIRIHHFLEAAVAALVIAVLTVGWRAYRTCRLNPAQTLRQN